MKLILFLFLLFVSSVGQASQYHYTYIDEMVDKKRLPDYCRHIGAFRKGTPRGQILHKRYGPDMEHMHHFCWALVDSQNGRLKDAIDNLNYVLTLSSSSFQLRPMILLHKAKLLAMNNRESEAIDTYRELLELKRESEEGYSGLANIFLKNKDKKTARTIILQGLEIIPDSIMLKNMLSGLD